jgi:hypothetical protein
MKNKIKLLVTERINFLGQLGLSLIVAWLLDVLNLVSLRETGIVYIVVGLSLMIIYRWERIKE